MNARIEKKLSKRLLAVAPVLFREAWVSEDPSELACEQASNVSHAPHIGGGTDYWGDGMDSHSLWSWWQRNWMWFGQFQPYPEGHEREHFPNTEGFKPTTKNLLRLAAGVQS